MLIMDAERGVMTMPLDHLCICDYKNLLSLSKLLGGGVTA